MEYEGTSAVPAKSTSSKSQRRSATTATKGTNEPQYLVAFYDTEKKSVELYRAPHFDINPIVKAKRQYTGKPIKSLSNDVSNAELRTTLGNTFGTRKAQKLLRSRELNQIDSAVLSDIRDEVVESVSAATNSLPTVQEMQETKEKNDLFLNSTKMPNPFRNLSHREHHSTKEWQRIRVENILNETDIESQAALFPYQSQYIKSRLSRGGDGFLQLF